MSLWVECQGVSRSVSLNGGETALLFEYLLQVGDTRVQVLESGQL